MALGEGTNSFVTDSFVPVFAGPTPPPIGCIAPFDGVGEQINAGFIDDSYMVGPTAKFTIMMVFDKPALVTQDGIFGRIKEAGQRQFDAITLSSGNVNLRTSSDGTALNTAGITNAYQTGLNVIFFEFDATQTNLAKVKWTNNGTDRVVSSGTVSNIFDGNSEMVFMGIFVTATLSNLGDFKYAAIKNGLLTPSERTALYNGGAWVPMTGTVSDIRYETSPNLWTWNGVDWDVPDYSGNEADGVTQNVEFADINC